MSITLDAYWVEVKDRIVLTGAFKDDNPQIGTLFQGLNVGQAQFFTNALSTTSRGINVVINYSPKIESGILNLSYAAYFNYII